MHPQDPYHQAPVPLWHPQPDAVEVDTAEDAAISALKQRIAELEQTVSDYELLLKELPDLFERKFQQRLEPLLEFALEQVRQLFEQQFIVTDGLLELSDALLQSTDRCILGGVDFNSIRLRMPKGYRSLVVGVLGMHDRTLSPGHDFHNPLFRLRFQRVPVGQQQARCQVRRAVRAEVLPASP